jgi:RNA polymerase sigma factor (sigma-70 family)
MGVLTDAEIYRKHADELIRFAQGLVGRVDAADVVSAAVVQSISTPKWPSVRNHRASLYRAVLNQAKKTHRDRQRRWDKELRAGAPPARPVPEVHPEVLDAIRHLSPQQRAVVVLTYWDDLAPDEVAEMLSVSEGSVRKQLARARAKLRKALG